MNWYEHEQDTFYPALRHALKGAFHILARLGQDQLGLSTHESRLRDIASLMLYSMWPSARQITAYITGGNQEMDIKSPWEVPRNTKRDRISTG